MRVLSIAIVLSIAVLLSVQPAVSSDNPRYKLQATDVINITVHNQPDLTTKARVTSDGSITFPLLGKVDVQGLTVQELEQKLKGLLEAKYLVTAQVLVFIEEYHKRQVSVMGEVKAPAKLDMPEEKDLTLMQAIAMAGGLTKHAMTNKVRVMRIENGEKKTITINVKDITDRGDKDKDIVLQPDDIVFVPESFF